MNNKRVEFIGSIIIFFVLLFVYSKWGPSIPVSLLTQTKGEPLVVSNTGKVAVVPDIARVTFGIESQGQSLKQVQSEVNTKSKTLTDSLKELGVKNEDIKTTDYNVYPEYDYSSRSPRITGYRVSTNYEIKIKDFDLVNEALTLATQNGANIVGNISFEVNEETKTKLTQDAREIAVNLAKDKAEGLAKASGITLGKIINISESGSVDFPRPVALYNKEIDLDMAQSETANIQAGETEIQVTVSLSYEIR